MKFRNLIMAAAFIFAVTSAFTIKSQGKGFMPFSYYVGGTCYVAFQNTDQASCNASFTGPQCTYQGSLIYEYDPTPPVTPPTCTVPLRQPF